VGNRFLENYVTPINPNVYIIPTPVRLHNLLDHQITSDKTVIGWIGRHENLLYVSHLQRVFAHLNRKYKDTFILKIICDEPLNLEDVIVINKRWSLEEELADLSEIDIGIMPLGSDDWSKGKCAFKILQYMSMGIPVVASPIGMNKEVITHGVNGYLAETEEEWIIYISRLINDNNLRKSLGYSGKQLVISYYTYEATVPLLFKVLVQCVRD
jgi:glycosyltransferase involved in cell wall biosynthesis